MDCHAKIPSQWTEVLHLERIEKLLVEPGSGFRLLTGDNKIIDVDENSNVAKDWIMLLKETWVSSICLESKSKKNSSELNVPDSRCLLQSVETAKKS